MRSASLCTVSALMLSLSSIIIAAPASVLHRPRANAIKSREAVESRSTNGGLTAEQLLTIAPTSNTCDNPPAAGECSTAEQAVPFITQSFTNYKVTSPAEQAALISLMAFETDDFKYKKNHYPGVPGQGTRNMQSPTFNAKYAASIPALSSQLSSVANDPTGTLNLLISNETYDFGSAAWFLTTQCSSDVRTQLQSGTQSAWESYISSCVGTTVTEARQAYWTRAVQALGVSTS